MTCDRGTELWSFARGEVHVWEGRLDAPPSVVARLRAALAPDELARARRYRRERDSSRFIVGRGLLRVLLAQYRGLSPAAVRMTVNRWGKPRLADGAGPEFNVSHAAGVVLYAVANRPVGVDVERIRDDVDYRPLADVILSPGERSALAALAPDARRKAFLASWTRKEAYVKARGQGFSLPVDRIELPVGGAEPAGFVTVDGDSSSGARWSLAELRPPPGFVAALAVEGPPARVVYGRWPGGEP